MIHIHGSCMICAQPLDVSSKPEIALVKKTEAAGSFPRIMPDGEIVMTKTSLNWFHSIHLQ